MRRYGRRRGDNRGDGEKQVGIQELLELVRGDCVNGKGPGTGWEAELSITPIQLFRATSRVREPAGSIQHGNFHDLHGPILLIPAI